MTPFPSTFLLNSPTLPPNSKLQKPSLQPITSTSKNAPHTPRRITINNTLHTSIRPRAQEVNPHNDNEDIQRQHRVSIDGLVFQPGDAAVDASHADVRYAPEDEAEEGVEERGHEGEEVGEEGDDFCDDECAAEKVKVLVK